MKENLYDFIIIGAGIIGSLIARYLTQYEVKILIIEKETDICMGASSRNSAIIHSGHDPYPGSLKAELNVRGNKIWEEIANDLAIPFIRTGSYVVAVCDEESNVIKKLYEQAIVNGVPGIRFLKKQEMIYREPRINPAVSSALWTPTTGVIDAFEATVASAEHAVINGVKLLLNTRFENFIQSSGRITGVTTNQGIFYCRWVINCAGLWSDEVMHKAGIRPEFSINPVRGEYLIFDASKITLNTVLYPVPTEKGKGTLVSTTTHGNVMVGPNAERITEKTDDETTGSGLTEIALSAKKLIPSLDLKDVIASFAGIRAKSNQPYRDFLIEIPEAIGGLVNLGGIDSPGLAAAPAIAEKVIELLHLVGMKLKPKKNWSPKRKPRPSFREMSHKERAELVKKNPAYGRIICRCEEITEGEIIDAIHSPIPAMTYDAIKRRTWMGTGRCQGAFDYPRVIEILAHELKNDPLHITKKGPGSEFLTGKTKG